MCRGYLWSGRKHSSLSIYTIHILSLFHTHTLTHSRSLSITHTHTLTLSHTHSHSLTHTRSLSLHTLTLTLTHTHYITFTLSPSLGLKLLACFLFFIRPKSDLLNSVYSIEENIYFWIDKRHHSGKHYELSTFKVKYKIPQT